MSEFFYRIFPEPRTETQSFNFNIFLDSKFAKRALEREISQENYLWIQNKGWWVLHTCGFKELKDFNPYSFIEGEKGLTYLLKSIELPRKTEENLCNLDFFSNGISRDIKDISDSPVYYLSSNVKSMEQSYILLMLWLNWFDLRNTLDFLPKRIFLS